MLEKMDLPNLSSLRLHKFGCHLTPEMPRSIKSLTLEDISIKWLRTGSQELANLVSITMKGVMIAFPIMFRLEVPNLQFLHLSSTRFTPNGENSIIDLSVIVGPEGFLSSVERLREISITSMTLSHNTATTLQGRSSIKKISLNRSQFRFSLLSSLADADSLNHGYLPNLTELQLNRCRTKGKTMSIQQLQEQCYRVRPDLQIIGDDRHGLTESNFRVQFA
jgi:hypothetical protein